jgi:ribosomal RNA-processing protein 12
MTGPPGFEPAADGGIVAELQSRHGHSAQPESQQVLAVLQAVLEVIGAQGMPATPTSIFAALMSALERPDAQQSAVVSAMGAAGRVEPAAAAASRRAGGGGGSNSSSGSAAAAVVCGRGSVAAAVVSGMMLLCCHLARTGMASVLAPTAAVPTCGLRASPPP